MELNTLKLAWQQQPEEFQPGMSNLEIMRTITARLDKVHRTVRWRDSREITAAIANIFIFGVWFWTVPQLLSRVGAAVVIAGSVLIIARIAWTHPRKRRAPPYLQMREFCIAERDRLDAQIRLLRSTLWWYFGPNLLGVNLFVVGVTGFNIWGFSCLAGTLALGLFLYRLNVQASRRRLLPIKNELDLLLAEIEKNGFSSGDTSK